MKVKKSKFIVLIVLSFLMVLIGFRLLFNSSNLGLSRAESWLHQLRGADHITYQLVMLFNCGKYPLLFGIGLATIIGAFYKILTINE